MLVAMKGSFESGFESGIDRPQEEAWAEVEKLIEASQLLMEPEARLTLKAMRLHDMRESMEALVEFFGNIDLVEDEMSFKTASNVLDMVYKSFDKIDVNHDELLSRYEVIWFANNLDGYFRQSLYWLAKNVGVIARAGIIEHALDGVSKRDLLEASDTFKGLSLIQENFDEMAELTDDGIKEINAKSVKKYIKDNRKELDSGEISSLSHVIRYLARFRRPDRTGVSAEELEEVTAETIWKDKKSPGSQQEEACSQDEDEEEGKSN